MTYPFPIPPMYTGSSDNYDKYEDEGLLCISLLVDTDLPDSVLKITQLDPGGILIDYQDEKHSWIDFDYMYQKQLMDNYSPGGLMELLLSLNTIRGTQGIVFLSPEPEFLNSVRSIFARYMNSTGLIDLMIEDYRLLVP